MAAGDRQPKATSSVEAQAAHAPRTVKMYTDEMTLPEVVTEVRRRLQAWPGYPVLEEALDAIENLQVYVAGGSIRNVLLGRPTPSKDWDFFLAGSGVAKAIEHFGRHGRLAHTPYGAPRWSPTDGEEPYADLMPIAEFVPGLWPCKDIIDVLNQFDITANAIAFDLRTGVAFDPQNGMRDTEERVARMVRFDFPDGPYVHGAPLDRNVVLWFRVLHYASTLGLTIEPLTRAWLQQRGDQRALSELFAQQFFRANLSSWEALDGPAVA